VRAFLQRLRSERVEQDLTRENQMLRLELEQARQALLALAEGQLDALSLDTGSPVLLKAAQEDLRANRQLLRAVFDGITDAVLLVRDDGGLVDANPAACALFGFSKSEIIARSLAELELDATLSAMWTGVLGGAPRAGRLQLRSIGGAQRLVDYSATLAILPGLHLLALRDVTEQRATEARFQAMIEKSHDGVSLLSADARALYQSPAVQRLFGWTAEQAQRMAWQDFVPEEEHHKLATVLERLVSAPGESMDVDFRMRHRDGSLRWVELVATNLLHDPLVAAIVTNFRDITARKTMQQENESFFELTPDLLCIAGMDGRFRRINQAWTDTLGWDSAELLSRPWLDFVHPDDLALTHREAARLAQGQVGTQRFENRYRCLDGSYRWLQWSCQPVVEDGLIYATARDITEQRISAERYRLLFTESPVPKFVIDGETRRFVDVNQASVELYGYSRAEFLELGFDTLVVPEEREHASLTWRIALEQAHVRVPARHHTTRTGERLEVDLTSKRIEVAGRVNIIVYVRDMTSQRKLEAQLAQAHRLESLGNLAGGVAHDFNNLMSIVLSYAMLMLEGLKPGDPFWADVEEIRKAAERASELTRQLLAFSRKQILEPRPVKLTAVLQGMERMLGRLLREDIALSLELAPDLGVVLADQGQLEQVIMNLAVNARDAMPEGGRLTFRAANVELPGSSFRGPHGLDPGRYVILTVTDTGHGMDAATRARIFEPFFTTKPKGQGTGLGLATTFGIVRQTGGHVSVESEVGKGTTFTIYLPRTDQALRPRTFLSGHASLTGSETILLVEDETQVRTVARSILTRAGYQVLEAANGEEALRIMTGEAPAIDLLLTDVVMPGMGGRELGERMSGLMPGLKVLYMSGYTDDAIVHHGVLEAGISLYQKPVTPHGLLRKLREVLDGACA
jgi:PAS domain S-box-containing protein